MPRKPRTLSVVPGALTHVIVRFVDGRFLMDDQSRDRYLNLLGEALLTVDWSLISYALMSSHIHLAMLAGDTKFSDWAHRLHTRFAMWMSWRRRQECGKTLGPVLGDRPSTYPLPLEQAAWTIAYLHRNPGAAGVVQSPSDSTWTSHRAYLRLSPPQAGLDVSLGLQLAGFRNTASGRASFHQWVCHTSQPTNRVPLLGAVAPIERSTRPTPDDIAKAAAAIVGGDPSLFSGPRTRTASLARRAALRAAQHFGYPLAAMRVVLKLSVSAASRLLRRDHDTLIVSATSDELLRRLGFAA